MISCAYCSTPKTVLLRNFEIFLKSAYSFIWRTIIILFVLNAAVYAAHSRFIVAPAHKQYSITHRRNSILTVTNIRTRICIMVKQSRVYLFQ